MKRHPQLLIAGALFASLLIDSALPCTWQPVYAYGTETTAHLNLLWLYIYEPNSDFSTSWKREEPKTVQFCFQSSDRATYEAVRKKEIVVNQPITSIDFDLLNCDFSTDKEPVVTLLSTKKQYLTFQVTLQDVYWTGPGNNFYWYISYPGKQLNGTMGTFPVQILEETASIQPEDSTSNQINLADTQGSGATASNLDFNDTQTVTTQQTPQVVNETTERQGEEMTPISSPAPNLIIRQYSYGADSVTAGTTFDLNIEFYNTSRKIPVENIVMSVETGEGLSIANSSNTYYFEKLNAQSALSQTIKLKALGTDQTASPTITVTFSYEYVDLDVRQSRTSSEKIAIPVYQQDRMEITEPTLPEEIWAGEEMILSFPYVNKGKSTLYNVSATVESDIPALQKVQNLGNFEPGKSGNVDIILEPDQPGEFPVKVSLTYENTSGEEIHKDYEYTVNVSQMEMPVDPMMPDPEMPIEEPQSNSMVGWIVGGIIAVVVVIGSVFLWRKKKKKNDSQQQDDTDWFKDDPEPKPTPSKPAQPETETPDEDTSPDSNKESQ